MGVSQIFSTRGDFTDKHLFWPPRAKINKFKFNFRGDVVNGFSFSLLFPKSLTVIEPPKIFKNRRKKLFYTYGFNCTCYQKWDHRISIILNTSLSKHLLTLGCTFSRRAWILKKDSSFKKVYTLELITFN